MRTVPAKGIQVASTLEPWSCARKGRSGALTVRIVQAGLSTVGFQVLYGIPQVHGALRVAPDR
jgi:pyrimidine deaminase RibD-like protein